ncbi:CHAD domain-containing protein [Glycomyces sp. A-F 0318]|uniref:CHAD domain-containing protein n=1 Tax=Glycomyces amatae TaxID=2881355 RepID=UPI001E2FAC9C|nr:CHAD domain-containing protein [Glycomyces amatae]MCD0445552.1 CHAD domain-containing protein [Glycomyces amatae]
MSTAAAPERSAPEAMTASTPAGVVVQSYISGQVDALNRAIAATERHAPGSAGAIRIAIHRLRTAIRGYDHLFAQTPRGGPELDQLLSALKRTEDLERLRVHFADRFDQLGLTVPEYPKWYAALEADVRDSYRRIERVHSQAWVAVLLGQVRMFAEHARFAHGGEKPASSLMGVLSQAKNHLLDTYARVSYAADPAVARDETRVAAREARFLAEAAAPALGRAAEEVVAAASALERLITQYRQAVIARNWLLRLPGADRAGRLTASLAELEHEHLRQLDEEIEASTSDMIGRWS